MTEQLNERERWLAWRAYLWGWESGSNGEPLAGEHEAAYVALGRDIPPDPNLARITELEAEVARLNEMYGKAVKIPSHILDRRDDEICRLYAEVARLNGLLNEVGDADYHLSSNTFFRDEVRSILSRRTAERKERGDG